MNAFMIRVSALVALVVTVGCGDPCTHVVDKVCGPGEGPTRACWDTEACRNALELRETTVLGVCSAALEDERDYPRCETCKERTEESPLPELPEPIPTVERSPCNGVGW